MELFKNTNFDFLGKKWPFIGFSLILTAAGAVSLIANHGPGMGIDFRGGAEIRLRFASEPPVEKIRAALTGKIQGDFSVQQISGKPEVLVGTESLTDQQVTANRNTIEATLRTMFGDASGKLDLNSGSAENLSDRLREPLIQSGTALTEEKLQEIVQAIEGYRTSHGGLVKSYDEFNGVAGVTPSVIDTLKQQTVLGPFTILSTAAVGPKIGADLTHKAVLAVGYALAGMLVYIAFRFEWIYGAAAVIAVFHDTLITIGIFSLVHKQISLTVVAALLTLVGYSMNDTIVVFDRIRENLKMNRRDSLTNIVNLSVNQTLSRTVLTSGLTLLTALSLWLFGGEVLNGFAFALVMGIIVGTYSSVFIASPILVGWQAYIDSRKSKSGTPSGGPAPVVAPPSSSSAKRQAASGAKQPTGAGKGRG